MNCPMKSLSNINSDIMKSNFIRTLIFLGIFLRGFTAFSQDGIPDKPQPPRLVNDFASILSPQEANTLEQKLRIFNDSTSTQIVIVTINDLGGRDETDFADRLGEKWGVGQKGQNNGIIVLIKPNGGQGERKALEAEKSAFLVQKRMALDVELKAAVARAVDEFGPEIDALARRIAERLDAQTFQVHTDVDEYRSVAALRALVDGEAVVAREAGERVRRALVERVVEVGE